MPWRRNLVTEEGVNLRPSRRVLAPAKEPAIIVVVGLSVGLWAFDSAGGDGRALLTFTFVLAFSLLAAWYVRLPD